MRKVDGAIGILKRIYTPKYIALNIAVAIVYYIFYSYLLTVQENSTIVLVTVPLWLIYSVIITASVLFTIAVYSARNTRNNQAKVSGSVLGTAATVFTGVVAGCGCTAPILLSLTAIGISASSVFSLVNFLNANQTVLFVALLAINVGVLAYYSRKLSNPSCKISRK